MSNNRTRKIIEHSQCSPQITANNLLRLVDGDLEHIGTAMVKGETISHDGFCGFINLLFSQSVKSYGIKPDSIFKVGTIILDEPPLKELQEGELFYYVYQHATRTTPSSINKGSWDARIYYMGFLKANQVFATKKGAEKYIEAMNTVARWEKN